MQNCLFCRHIKTFFIEGDIMAQIIRKANSWMDRLEMKMGEWAEKVF
jgi:hypothetical protein